MLDRRPGFSICHATARVGKWQESYLSCKSGAGMPDMQYVLSYDPRWGDFSRDRYFHDVLAFALPPNEPMNSVANWNNAVRHSNGKVIILNADDFTFPLGWDVALTAAIFDAHKTFDDEFVIHVDTGCPERAREDRLMALGIMSRKLYARWGYALYPEYESMYSDVDFTEHAYQDGVVIQARHLLFQHRHREWGMSPDDDVYRHQNRPEAYAVGHEILNRRRAEGFAKWNESSGGIYVRW